MADEEISWRSLVVVLDGVDEIDDIDSVSNPSIPLDQYPGVQAQLTRVVVEKMLMLRTERRPVRVRTGLASLSLGA